MTFNLLRGLHILAVIAWMAGLLYLPRLFAYHTKAAPGGEMDATFQTMERKLFRIIMNPAMIAVVVFGGTLIWYDGTRRLGWDFLWTPWFIAKAAGIVFLIWWHHFLGRARKAFVLGKNTRTERFWRAVNELPFLAAILIVIAATTKFGL
jgi:putative membrane protein